MHVDTELIAFLGDELPAPDRARVARHLEDCAACRETVAAFREVLGELRSTAPEPPKLDWTRYGADLRAKLPARRRRWSIRTASWSWTRPLPLGLAVAAAGILVVVAVQTGDWGGGSPPDPVALEQTVIGGRLDLLQHYDVVERLDLLEDLDVIRHLDRNG